MISPEFLTRMDAALAHHGSEGGGIWQGGEVGLGQRLRCFTPQDIREQQPLIGADGLLTLVCDARIDNRAELLAAWKDAGHVSFPMPAKPAETPDSEFILHAYNTWGADCATRLAGMFAFALWDKRTQTLFAARSPIVAPSLLYFASEQVFAFATTPSGLHALPFISRELNEEYLAAMPVQMYDGPPDATLYRHILRLPTGFSLTVNREGLKIQRCWQPDLNREIRFTREEDYLEAFTHLFERVVSDHLCSLTPVALQMSGGLDSASVAATTARLLSVRGERLTAFTEVPRPGFTGTLPGQRYADETPFVEAIAALHGNIDLNLIRTDGQFFLTDLDRLFPYLEMPFANTSNRVWIEAILRETSRRGMKVLLDGVQGNITISWRGGGLLPGLIHDGKWTQALGQAWAMAQNGWSSSALRIFVGQGILPLLPDALKATVERLRNRNTSNTFRLEDCSPIHPDFAAARQVQERVEEQNIARIHPATASRAARYALLANQDFGAYLCAYRAMYGVDMRTPPADVRLAEFCLALPEDQYLKDGVPRRLIRLSMASRLPEIVLSNRLRGVQAADWFERLNGARDQTAGELSCLEKSSLARRVLDLQRMRRLFERMPKHASEHETIYRDYQLVFQRGLMIGRFLRWFESGRR